MTLMWGRVGFAGPGNCAIGEYACEWDDRGHTSSKARTSLHAVVGISCVGG